MKIKLNPEQQPAFVKALKRVESVTRTRSTIPVLAGVLITADDNGVLLQSTNLNQAFEIRVEAEVKEGGKCGVVASDMLRISSLSSETKIETEGDHHLSIKGDGFFRIPLFATNDFPSFPVVEKGDKSTLTASELRKLLRVSHAMALPTSGKHVLQGVCYNSASKESAACNGSSLALSTPKPSKEGWDTIIPDVACRILVGLLSEEGDYSVGVGAVSASFESKGTIFSTRLIEGNFPNFHVVLKPSDFSAMVNRKALIEGIDRACVAHSDSARVDMVFEGSTLTLSVQGRNGDSSVPIDLLSPLKKAPQFKVALNSSFLSDAAKSMDSDEISLEFTDDLSPLAMRGDGYAIIQIMRNK